MTDVDTSSPTSPAAIDAVPLRHPWRWVAAVVIVILVVLFLYGAATNKAFGWDTYAKYLFDKRVTHSREADEILRENFGKLVYNTRIRKTIRFAEAPVKGSSVLAYEPAGEAAGMYRDLAKEVLNGQKPRQHA